MNTRVQRLAFLLLFLNIAMVLLGAIALAWQSSNAAVKRAVPTDLTQALQRPHGPGAPRA